MTPKNNFDSEHSNTVPKRKRQLCGICDKRFTKPSQLIRHLRIHTGEKPFQCLECKRSFNQKGTLKLHIQSVHNKLKPFTCEICQVNFAYRGNLVVHQKYVHAENCENIFGCVECPRLLRSLSALNEHVLRKHVKVRNELKNVATDAGIQMDACDEPEKNSVTDNGIPNEVSGDFVAEVKVAYYDGEDIKRMEVKLKKVGNEKLHVCNFCSFLFCKPSNLIRHLRTHTKERPFKCQFCAKSFPLKSTLNAHVLLHVRERRRKCKKCHKTFASLQQLKEHQRFHNKIAKVKLISSLDEDKVRLPKSHVSPVVHQRLPSSPAKEIVEKPFQCFLCNKRFTAASTLDFHLKNHAKFRCNPNQDSFKTTSDESENKNAPDLNIICVNNEVSASEKFATTISKKSDHSCSEMNETVDPDTNDQDDELTQNFATSEQPVNEGQSMSRDITTDSQKGTSQADPNQCHYCSRRFKKPSDLIRHIRIHTGERPFQCPTCGKSFRVKSTCVSHMRIHSSSTKTVECSVCKNKFANKSSLNVHMRLHRNFRPFRCNECFRDFRTSGHLKAHQQSHLNQNLKGTKPPSSKLALESVRNRNSTSHASVGIIRKANQPPSYPRIATINFTDLQVDSTKSFSFPGSESECLKLIGSLQLPLEDLNNIQITSVDLNNIQVDDSLQNFIIINTSTSAMSSLEGDSSIHSMTPTDQNSLPRVVADSNRFGSSNVSDIALTRPISSSDPFLTEASAEVNTERCRTSGFSDHHETLHGISDNLTPSEKQINSKQCPDCGRIFSKPSQMIRHQRIHTGDKPWICEICQNTFTQKSSLDTHIKFTHSEVRPYQCSECPFKTVQRGALKKHCSRAHPSLNVDKLLEISARDCVPVSHE